MGDFGDAERQILSFMVEGTEFEFEDRKYVVELSGKPTCHKGEPKTDIYVLAKSSLDEKEISDKYLALKTSSETLIIFLSLSSNIELSLL